MTRKPLEFCMKEKVPENTGGMCSALQTPCVYPANTSLPSVASFSRESGVKEKVWRDHRLCSPPLSACWLVPSGRD